MSHTTSHHAPLLVGGRESSITRSPRRWGWVVAFIVFLAVASLVASFFYSFYGVGIALQTAQVEVSLGQTSLRDADFEGASDHLVRARDELLVARDGLARSGVWRNLPYVGMHVRALEDAAVSAQAALESGIDLVDVGRALSDAVRLGRDAVGVGASIEPTRSFRSLSRDEKRRLLAALGEQIPRLRVARDKMELAYALWRRVPATGLAEPFRRALQPLAETIPQLERMMGESVGLVDVLVPLAGYPSAQHYLIVLQNADEQRGSGGFIGTVGTVDVDSGDFSRIAFTDVYAIDNPVSGVWKDPSPDPIARYLGQQHLFMRDANWSPDFPTAAETILDKYKREKDLQGAAAYDPTVYIAIEPGFFASLLKLTGPITVNGKTYDADNFYDQLEYDVEMAWHQKGLPVDQRKAVVSEIGDKIFARLTALPASRWPELVDLALQSIKRKQIMVYARDRALLAELDRRGWTGRMKPTQGDFLSVIDSNMAALKTDGVMEKKIAYDLDATDPAGPKATVTLTYRNTNPTVTWRYTRYRSYTRVYVPEGSQLLESSGAMKDDVSKTGGVAIAGNVDVYRELGKTVFGAFWSVEPGKTRTLRFTYRLPPALAAQIASGAYRLDWQKQPGTDDATLTLHHRFGKNVGSASPPEDKTKWGDDRYEVTADSLEDRSFHLDF